MISVRKLYAKVSRAIKEDIGDVGRVGRAIISTLANEYTEDEVIKLMKRYRVKRG